MTDTTSEATSEAVLLIEPTSLRERVALAIALAAGAGAEFEDLREADPEMWEANREDREYFLRQADAAVAAITPPVDGAA